IAACVIGGASLSGGRGSVVNTFFGVLIIAVLGAGLAQIGAQEPTRRFVTGCVCIRVRNYEADLSAIRVPLDDVLGPIGVRLLEGEVASIDLAEQTVTVTIANGQRALSYDRLVFALGSQLLRPNVPGLAEHGFDVDTYNGAARLNTHL